MIRFLVAALSLCLLCLGASGAHAAKRVAFVVGIDSYDNLPAEQQLKKAVNDAHAVGETLAGLGYQVQSAENTGRLDFLRQWQLFLNRLEPGDETAIFFAGHGVEIDGQNFLLPRDVPRIETGEEEVLKASGLALSALLDQVRDRRPQVSLYVVDACRDNPFVDAKGRGIGGTRGLARVEPPSGTFIMFSAGAKESALDRLSDTDPNPNSVYTRTLLPRLKAQGKITDIARDVRREVRELAASVAHVQTPAYYDEVVGDFCPAGCESTVAAADAANPVPPPTEQPPSLAAKTPAPKTAESETPAPETPVSDLPVKLPPAESAPPSPAPIRTAVFTPRMVQPPGPGRPPIQECDRLAATPDNPDSVAAGDDWNAADTGRAIAACKQAMETYPNERRFAFQLAQSYFFANQPELAKPLLESLHRDGYPIATTFLGYVHLAGRGVPKDPAEALRLFRQASEAGDQLGTSAIGYAYESGQGVDKDEAEAVNWYRKAAEMGSLGALIKLGDSYAEGKLGLAKDGAQAADWYVKAAAQGNVLGLYHLGLLYREGLGVPKDTNEAERLFAEADAQKRGIAMLDVGQRFYSGQGVAKDEAEAVKWFRKAAELGERNGMFYLGLAYRYGTGAPKDGAEAVRWYRKAAEAGDITSMTGLADMYEKGEGVPKDAAEAKRWRAAVNDASMPAGSQAPAKQIDADAGKHFGPEEYAPGSLVFAPSGGTLYVLFSAGYLKKIDPKTGSVGKELGTSGEFRPCCELAISADGKFLASGNFEKMALLFDAKSGELIKSFKGHSDQVTTVAISPDGKRLASGSNDKTIKIWDIDSGALLHTLEAHTDRINAIAFSPDGAVLASGGWDQTVKFWDVAQGSLLASLPGHSGLVYSLGFTADGSRLVSGGSDARIRVWDVAAKKELINFGTTFASLCCIAVSPDGKTVASGASDSVARLWDIQSGALIANIAHENWIRALAFSPDGSRLATSSEDKMVSVFDLKGALEARR